MTDLVKAISDYGYYAQQTLGGSHTPMTKASDIGITATDGKDDTYASHAISIKKSGESVEATNSGVTYTLDLDSNTVLHVYLPAGSYVANTTTATEDTASLITKASGSTYETSNIKIDRTTDTTKVDIQFKDISAHELADKFTIPVIIPITTGNTTTKTAYTIQISAMSYVNSVMSKTYSELNTAAELGEIDTTNHPKATKLKQAVTALYNYYKATVDYRANPTATTRVTTTNLED